MNRVVALLILFWSPGQAFAQPPVSVSNEWPTAAPPSAPAGYRAGDAFNQLDVAATLRGIYDRFTDLSRRSGQDIRFVLSDVETFRPEKFAELSLLDVMYPPQGRVLATRTSSSWSRLPSDNRFSYVSVWETQEETADVRSQRKDSLAELSFSQALALEEAKNFELSEGLVAVSTFGVTVEFEGQRESYRAAVLWREFSRDLVVFHLNDLVSSGISAYYAESFDADREVVPLDRLERENWKVRLSPLGLAVTAAEESSPLACIKTSELCEETRNEFLALSSDLVGQPATLSSPTAVPLAHLESSSVVHQGKAVAYLLAEWAVVASKPSGIHVEAPSSTAFGEETAKELASLLWGESPTSGPGCEERSALLVALPSHEASSRSIAIPELRLAGDLRNTTLERGKMLVLADFAEDHTLQELELLYSPGGAGSWKTLLALERGLSLAPTVERHRVISFAWLSVGETIELESYLSYLPRSCCGGSFCD
jgi:hypothetical protein